MSMAIEYNFPEGDINLLKGVNFQLISEEHKLIISPIDENFQELVPDNPSIVIQMALPNITLICILNLFLSSAEIIGMGVFCKMFSFEELIRCQHVDEIKFLLCVKNCINNENEDLLLDKFLVFCGSITQELSPLIEKVIKEPELIKFIFNDTFQAIN